LLNGNVNNFFESLILAQDERWRRALGMQVERLCEAQGISNFKSQISNLHLKSQNFLIFSILEDFLVFEL